MTSETTPHIPNKIRTELMTRLTQSDVDVLHLDGPTMASLFLAFHVPLRETIRKSFLRSTYRFDIISSFFDQGSTREAMKRKLQVLADVFLYDAPDDDIWRANWNRERSSIVNK